MLKFRSIRRGRQHVPGERERAEILVRAKAKCSY